MKTILMCFSFLFVLVACSNENGINTTKEFEITKVFVEENAELGLTYDEIRRRFGTAELADIVDNTETWIYYSSKDNNYKYDNSKKTVSHDEIKSGNLQYQFYITFIDGKAFIYSYFYLGDDGKVWKYEISPYSEPLNIPVSD
nr:hypothetical protein [Lysinibacillus timonensis]